MNLRFTRKHEKTEDEDEDENEDEGEDEDEDEDENEDEGCRLTPTPGAPGLPTTFFSEQESTEKHDQIR
jgi:hypothetical protein